MNCGALTPDSIDELLPLFQTDNSFQPDIYVVALQEIVQLNAKNCLKKDTKRLDYWRKTLTETLDIVNAQYIQRSGQKLSEEEHQNQQLVYVDKAMVGCYLAVFLKRKLAARLKPKSIQICKVKSGTMGTTGNKGAVCLRFQIDGQAIMIINSHLISGRRRDEQQTGQLAKIF